MDLRALAGLAVLVVATGCASTSPQQRVSELRRAVPNPRILLLPLDVELTELTAFGDLVPKADWTAAASRMLVTGLRAEARQLGFGLVDYADVKVEGAEGKRLDQLYRLHAAVGKTIMANRTREHRLPNKGEALEWTLGTDVRALKARTGADYALFIHVRDSYASTYRKAAMVGAALLRFGIPGGTQVGFASLVDLDDGNVVWLNSLERITGDLRTAGPAAETIGLLLTGFPR